MASSNIFPELYKPYDITSVRCPPPVNTNYGVNIKRKFNNEGDPSYDASIASVIRIFSTDTPTTYELETVKRHLSKRIEELRPLSFFMEPDKERFPAIGLAYEVMSLGGISGAVFNAAKETALDGFLSKQI